MTHLKKMTGPGKATKSKRGPRPRTAARAKAGGPAMQAGARYQNRAAAWFAVQMLAEADLPWDLPEGTTIASVSCETTYSVDDIFAQSSQGGGLYGQAKNRLIWNSELLSALEQCVRQYSAPQRPNRTNTSLDLKKDRLLLIGGANSSESIRVHLPRVLARLRAPLSALRRVGGATTNKAEKDAFAKLKRALTASWRRVNRSHLKKAEFRRLCSLLYVHILDVDGDGEQVRAARSDLQKSVVSKRDQAPRAWTEIVAACTDLAVLRSGTDREQLRQTLQAKRIALQALPSYNADVSRLKDLTARAIQRLAKYAEILFAGRRVRIDRTCLPLLERSAKDGNVVVVGDPGSGKSGVLHGFVSALRSRGIDFVLMAADEIAALSLGHLREELDLEHDILEVLAKWTGKGRRI